MEETQIGTPNMSEASITFPPRRRGHLKSETYRTLVRILSHFHDDSPSSIDDQPVHHELNAGNGSNRSKQKTEKQVLQHPELVGSDSTKPKSSAAQTVSDVSLSVDDNASQDIEFSEQMSMDQIEQFMGFYENEDLSNGKDVVGFQDQETTEQKLMAELEIIVKGNEECPHETDLNLFTAFDQNQRGRHEVDNQQEHVGCQKLVTWNSGNVDQKLSSLDNVVMGENSSSRDSEGKNTALNTETLDFENERQPREMNLNSVSASDENTSHVPINESGEFEEAENLSHKVSEDFDMSLDKNSVADTLNPSKCNDEQFFMKTNAPEIDHEIPLKKKELDKSACMGDMADLSNHVVEGVDIEEGEISGDDGVDDNSMDMLPQDAVVTKDNDINGRVELQSCKNNKMVCTPETVGHEKTENFVKGDENDTKLGAGSTEKKNGLEKNTLVLHGQILEEDATRDLKRCIEKQDAEVGTKKRRGPSSKENKAKKKRKKRAEKNKQLGVKRLKLPPISKPKPITYCRHYMKGRCLEGDKCKFSHDVVPLTKSMPCCHFARHSCMKGDDCPYDHQLSKYPCSNFASNSFCIRGDNCMFSHKILPKEVGTSVSNAFKPEQELAPVDNSTYKKQVNNGCASQQDMNVLAYSMGIRAHKNTEQIMKETASKQSGLVHNGNTFSAAGNLPLVDNNKFKRPISSPNMNASLRVGNLVDKNLPPTVLKSNEILIRTPSVVAPRGINFLSFGRDQPGDSSCRRSASSSPSLANGVKLSLPDNSNLQNQVSSAPNSNSTSTLKGTQPAVTPKGINFLSFGKASVDDSGGKGKVDEQITLDNGTNSCVKEKQIALDKRQDSSTSSPTLPSSSVSIGRGLDHLASKIYKDTSHSAQKALLSTLAFAAEYESGMKFNRSIGAPAFATEDNKETKNNSTTEGSKNDSTKASKFLEFLSSFGGKSHQ
ncbi:hypothetical protein UlMin_022051 [Ulmus minor]